MDGREFFLECSSFSIGRGADNEVSLPLDDDLENQEHLKICSSADDTWFMRNNSEKPAYLDNKKVMDSTEIREGQIIRLGKTDLLISHLSTASAVREETTARAEERKESLTEEAPEGGTITCYGCGASNDASARWCGNCGRDLKKEGAIRKKEEVQEEEIGEEPETATIEPDMPHLERVLEDLSKEEGVEERAAEGLIRPRAIRKPEAKRKRRLVVFLMMVALILAGGGYALAMINPWLWFVSGPMMLTAALLFMMAICIQFDRCPVLQRALEELQRQREIEEAQKYDLWKPGILPRSELKRDRELVVLLMIIVAILAGGGYALTLITPWLWFVSGPMMLITAFFFLIVISVKFGRCPYCHRETSIFVIGREKQCTYCKKLFIVQNGFNSRRSNDAERTAQDASAVKEESPDEKTASRPSHAPEDAPKAEHTYVPSEEEINGLIQVLKGSDEVASEKAMRDLSDILTYSTSDMVIELLGDRDWRIRRKAFGVLFNTTIFSDDELIRILRDKGWDYRDIRRVMPNARLDW